MRPNHYLEELFVDLRSRYFPNRMRAYSVRVDDDLDDQSGYCDSTLRVIAVGAGLLASPLELRRTLVHEMCHVGIPNHGRAFLKQLRRVAQLGEPAAVLELREYTGRPISSSTRTRRLRVHRDIPPTNYQG